MPRRSLSSTRRGLIALTVASALCAVEPAPLRPLHAGLDSVRFTLARWISWPWRGVAHFNSESEEAREERAAIVRTAVRDRFDAEEALGSGGPGIISVIATSRSGRHVAVLAGRKQGIRQGMRIDSMGVFIGVVDRVDDHVARVLLASDPSCTYSGTVVLMDSEEGQEAGGPHVLLRGGRKGRAVPKRGDQIRRDLIGFPVFTRDSGSSEIPLLVGRVVRQESTDGVVVALSADPLLVDEVSVSSEAVRPTRDAFEDVEARVILPGESTVGGGSLLVSAGVAEGVVVGSTVSLDGRLIGVVNRVGRTECRMMGFRNGGHDTAVRLVDRQEDGIWMSGVGRYPGCAEDFTGQAFSRGRETIAPRGLWVAALGAPDGDPLLNCEPGTKVVVHVFRFHDELRRLDMGGSM